MSTLRTIETREDKIRRIKQKFQNQTLDQLKGRASDIADIMTRQRSDDAEVADQAYDDFYQYGLSFDYVPPFTFEEQRAGYWRWQISWGGPGEEFRIYVDPVTDRVKEVDFYYTEDWGNCHTINLDRIHHLNQDKLVSNDLNEVFGAIDQLMEGRS